MYETVDLSIIPVGEMPVVHCSQYDTNRLIRFVLTDGEDPFTFGFLVSVTTTIRKVDGTLWKYEDTAPVLVSSRYEVATDEQMTACAGNNYGELTIKYRDPDVSEDEIKISTLNFILKVELSPETGGLVSMSEINNLAGQIALIVDQQLDNYYTKAEIDDQIEDIVTEQVTPIVSSIVSAQVPSIVESEMDNYYTKSETDTLLDSKANTSDMPDMDDYYTKSEVDELVGTFDIIDTGSGSIVTIDNGGANIPVKNLISIINPDVNGYTDVDIHVSGKNLIPSLFGTNTISGITYTVNNDDSITVTGSVSGNNSNRNYGHIVLPAGTYVLSGIPDTLISTTRYCGLVIARDQYSGSQDLIVTLYSNIATSVIFTLNETTDCYLKIYIYSAAGEMPVNTVFKVQIERAEEATEYEQYKGNIYNVSLGETLTQGGILNVTTGLLTRTDETTSQLTATAVNTLSGLNNIYSNTGDVSVEYFNDKSDQLVALYNVLGVSDNA